VWSWDELQIGHYAEKRSHATADLQLVLGPHEESLKYLMNADCRDEEMPWSVLPAAGNDEENKDGPEDRKKDKEEGRKEDQEEGGGGVEVKGDLLWALLPLWGTIARPNQ